MNSLTESQRLQFTSLQDCNHSTALHCASHNLKLLKTILSSLPDAHRLRALGLRKIGGDTVLHSVAHDCNPESICTILSLLPESQRLQAVNMQGGEGKTVWQVMKSEEDRRSIMHLLRDTGESVKKRPHEARRAEETDSERSVAKRARLDSN